MKTSRDIRIFESRGHGKTVKGAKKTSTIQVREYGVIQDGYLLIAQFRFDVGNPESKNNAIAKAFDFRRSELKTKSATSNPLTVAANTATN